MEAVVKIMKPLIYILILAASGYAQQCRSVNGLPGRNCSPGVARTQDVQIICHGGSTSQFRPDRFKSLKLKGIVMKEYGVTDWKAYTLDHLISIEIGGDGFDTRNMFMQTKAAARKKDLVENFLHREICSGRMTPAAAQTAIASNWKVIKVK